MPVEKVFLCRLDEIPDNGSKGIEVKTGNRRLEIFIIRRDSELYGYINSCPHTGVNLDWTPNQFLDNTGKLIQCATHGALFQIEDGLCISGPCAGDSLTPVSILLQTGGVFLKLHPQEGI